MLTHAVIPASSHWKTIGGSNLTSGIYVALRDAVMFAHHKSYCCTSSYQESRLYFTRMGVTMLNLIIVLAVACIVWYIVATIRIMDYVQKKGVKINWILIRLFLPSYVSTYQKLTREETGKTGIWFYQWIISINGLLVSALIAILIKKGVLR